MSVLLVCHSVGDTNALLPVAEIIKQEQKPYILAVGATAEAKLRDGVPGAEVLFLSDWIGKENAALVEDSPLTEKMLAQVKKHLKALEVTRALIGTPSKNDAAAPFQIAEILSAQLKSGIVFNDYLFEEKEHTFWKTLKKQDEWQRQYTFFMPLPYAVADAKDANSSVFVDAVGHSSIDAALNAGKVPLDLLAENRNALKVDGDAILFISGTKDAEADRELLKALLETLSKDSQLNNIQIRFGLHPGAGNLQAYIEQISTLFEEAEFSDFRSCFKFIITEKVAAKIDSSQLDADLLLSADISGDEAAMAADGVACSVPATLLNKKLISGGPAYSHQDKRMYIEGALTGPGNLSLFCLNVSNKKTRDPMTREDLGLKESSDDAATVMAKTLLAP